MFKIVLTSEFESHWGDFMYKYNCIVTLVQEIIEQVLI